MPPPPIGLKPILTTTPIHTAAINQREKATHADPHCRRQPERATHEPAAFNQREREGGRETWTRERNESWRERE